MSVILKSTEMHIKNSNTNEYQTINVIAEQSADEAIARVESAKNTAISNIQTKASETTSEYPTNEEVAAMLAPIFSESTVYNTGDYVRYTTGTTTKLYRITADHATGTTWTNTSKVKVNLGNEIGDLNAVLARTGVEVTGIKSMLETRGQYIITNPGIATSQEYYKHFSALTIGKEYLVRLAITQSGEYTLLSGTDMALDSMIDKIGTFQVEANVPTFTLYKPTVGDVRYTRLSGSVPYHVDFYEVTNEINNDYLYILQRAAVDDKGNYGTSTTRISSIPIDLKTGDYVTADSDLQIRIIQWNNDSFEYASGWCSRFDVASEAKYIITIRNGYDGAADITLDNIIGHFYCNAFDKIEMNRNPNRINYDVNKSIDVVWEVGGINASSGEKMHGGKRLRTRDILYIGDTEILKVNVEDGYALRVFYYKEVTGVNGLAFEKYETYESGVSFIPIRYNLPYVAFLLINNNEYANADWEHHVMITRANTRLKYVQSAWDKALGTYYKYLAALLPGHSYMFDIQVDGSGEGHIGIGKGEPAVENLIDKNIDLGYMNGTGKLSRYIPTSICDLVRFDLGQITPGWEMQVYEICPAEQDDLPAYYEKYINDKIKEINALDDNSGIAGDSFVYITDYHRQLNMRYSPILIQRILQHTGTRLVFFGGDTHEWEESLGKAIEQVSGYISDFAEIKDKLYNIRGNHEYNQHWVRHGRRTSEIMMTNEQIYSVYNKYNEQNYVSVSALGDYAVDNVAQKIRYYFVGCLYDSAIQASSLIWILEEFERIPDGYSIVVLTHAPFELKSITGPMYVQENVDKINRAMEAINSKSVYDGHDYSNVNAHALCIIGGHVHFDVSTNDDVVEEEDTSNHYNSTVPIIGTTTDSLKQNSAGYMYNYLERTPGTITEQAFDVCHLDLENKRLKMIRIGAGEDRVFLLP